MQMRLHELRTLIVEAMDPMRLIVLGDDTAALIEDDGDEEKMRAGMITSYDDDDDVYEVVGVWANDPRAAVAIFTASLVARGRLLPDESLSPAAQAIIKRWYARNKNNGSVLPGPDRATRDDEDDEDAESQDPAYNSIYTPPPGMTSPVPISFDPVTGPEASQIRIDVKNAFYSAYSDVKKTGNANYKLYFKNQNWDMFMRSIINVLESDDKDLSRKMKSWMFANAALIRGAPIPWRDAHVQWGEYVEEYGIPNVFGVRR